MIALLGTGLAAGLLLIASPWLWPPQQRTERTRAVSAMAALWESAGFSHVPPRVLVVTCLAAGAMAGAVAWLLTAVWLLALLAAAAGVLAPVFWLRARARRLIRARRTLWPDVCDLLIASVRAGLSLSDALSALAHSAPPALAAAFARFARDIAASGHFESALDRLKLALADPMGDRIVETVRMARQVGGTELVPVLRSLSASVRTEAALRGEVESRQSWTRGAAVLGVSAPWVIVALLAMRPEAADAYSSPLGTVLIVSGALVSVVAFRVMIRIGGLPEPRRWFA